MKYSNIPSEKRASSSDSTTDSFNEYYNLTVELNNDELVAMTGFFASRGFDNVAAELTAIAILTQAKKDGYTGMQVMDTLYGLDEVGLSNLVAEILNYNRFKTSVIGIKQMSSPSAEVLRNITEGTMSTYVVEPYIPDFIALPTIPETLIVNNVQTQVIIFRTISGNLLSDAVTSGAAPHIDSFTIQYNDTSGYVLPDGTVLVDLNATIYPAGELVYYAYDSSNIQINTDGSYIFTAGNYIGHSPANVPLITVNISNGSTSTTATMIFTTTD